MSVLPAGDSEAVAEETKRECAGLFFYNAPNGKIVELGCEMQPDRLGSGSVAGSDRAA